MMEFNRKDLQTLGSQPVIMSLIIAQAGRLHTFRHRSAETEPS